MRTLVEDIKNICYGFVITIAAVISAVILILTVVIPLGVAFMN